MYGTFADSKFFGCTAHCGMGIRNILPQQHTAIFYIVGELPPIQIHKQTTLSYFKLVVKCMNRKTGIYMLLFGYELEDLMIGEYDR